MKEEVCRLERNKVSLFLDEIKKDKNNLKNFQWPSLETFVQKIKCHIKIKTNIHDHSCENG
jgi:hypothetical protein